MRESMSRAATSPIREPRMTSSYAAIRVQLRKSSKKRPAPDSPPPPSIARSLGAARFSSTPCANRATCASSSRPRTTHAPSRRKAAATDAGSAATALVPRRLERDLRGHRLAADRGDRVGREAVLVPGQAPPGCVELDLHRLLLTGCDREVRCAQALGLARRARCRGAGRLAALPHERALAERRQPADERYGRRIAAQPPGARH